MKKTIALVFLFTISLDFSVATDHLKSEENLLKREVMPQEEKKHQLLAKMGNDLTSGSYRQLFIYSLEKLKNLEFRVGEAENWNAFEKASSPTHEAYTSSSYLPSARGQKLS